MKPQLTRSKKLPVKPTDGEVSLSFRDELVATIHGAFGVAVDIAVLEVTKLVGEAMAELRGRMQRENEALKQRLRSAEAKLDSVRRAASPVPRRSDALDPDSPVPRRSDALDPDSPVPRRSDALDPEEEQTQQRLGCFRDICQNGHMHSKELGDPACREPAACDALLKEEVSTGHNLPPLLPRGDDRSTVEQVTIKEEEQAEVEGGPGCCFDSLGVEDFGPDSLSLVQSKMLEEWKPDLLDIQSQDPNALMPCTSLALAHPPNMTASVPSADDLPSLSSEFPNIFQPAVDPDQPAGGVSSCKNCGQTFEQPSLLQRHYSQCQQKLQQSGWQPAAGTKRTKLQLYPPGCSPFRCTECNRGFNRLENLKRHLLIHTGERPYTCCFCFKCFRHSGALTRHVRIHTGEKPYVCGQCGRAFPNSGGLKFHQRSHNKPQTQTQTTHNRPGPLRQGELAM